MLRPGAKLPKTLDEVEGPAHPLVRMAYDYRARTAQWLKTADSDLKEVARSLLDAAGDSVASGGASRGAQPGQLLNDKELYEASQIQLQRDLNSSNPVTRMAAIKLIAELTRGRLSKDEESEIVEVVYRTATLNVDNCPHCGKSLFDAEPEFTL